MMLQACKSRIVTNLDATVVIRMKLVIKLGDAKLRTKLQLG